MPFQLCLELESVRAAKVGLPETCLGALVEHMLRLMLENPVLALRCQRTKALNDQLAQNLAVITAPNKRARIAFFAVSLAHEHHSGFVRLMDSEHFASSAAILRPIAEAAACAHWITYAAKPEWVNTALTDAGRDPPTLDKMINALSNCGVAFDGIKSLRRLLQQPAWTRFHSFTHGGMDQLARRPQAQTFDQSECHANFIMADVFLLSGAAIATAWSDSIGLRGVIGAEYDSINNERRRVFGGPAAPPWKGLPPPPSWADADQCR